MMTSTELWLVTGMAAVTFLCRYPLMAMAGRWELPPTLRRVLDYVGPAVLAAVIAPELFAAEPIAHAVPFLNPRLLAGLAAGVIAWRTGSVWLTVIVALLILALWQTWFA
jgi:branched-subunit amino acid transport protein